jgi:hypothetical protein
MPDGTPTFAKVVLPYADVHNFLINVNRSTGQIDGAS